MSNQDQEPGVHQTTYKQPGSKVPTDATQASLVQVDSVEGETILLDRSSAERIKGERLTMKASKASNIDSSSIQMEKSAAFSISSERVAMQDSAAMQLSADSVRMVKSRAMLVRSNETTLEDGSQAVLVITGGITGEARALVTVPAAAIVGALLAVLGTLIFAVTRGVRK